MNRIGRIDRRRGAAYPVPLFVTVLAVAGMLLGAMTSIRLHRGGPRLEVDRTNSRLAWVSHGRLYTLSIRFDGEPVHGAESEQVCRAPAACEWTDEGSVRFLYPGNELRYSPTGGQIAVACRQPAHPVRDHDTELWIVDVSRRTAPRYLGRGDNPYFSPDGRSLAFTGRDDDDSALSDPGVRIANVRTGRVRTFRKSADEPFWSADGCEIALADYPPGGERRFLIVDARTGRRRFATREQCCPIDPILSPDGRYLAAHFSLSRPLTGHSVIDRRTGQPLPDRFTPAAYAPGLLYGWSRDGRWMLWNWRTPNPQNDGCWRADNVGLTSADGRVRRLIGPGRSAVFSPDAAHVLWLQLRHPGEAPDEAKNPFDLMWRSIDGGEPKRLIADVEAFAVTPGAASAK